MAAQARAASGATQRLRQPLAGFNARLLMRSRRALRTLCPRQVQSSGCLLFASVLPALVLRSHRGSDDSSGPQLHASEGWRARPVAPKTAGRESSLSAININWPQSHEDRDTPVDQDASRPGRQPPQAAREEPHEEQLGAAPLSQAWESAT